MVVLKYVLSTAEVLSRGDGMRHLRFNQLPRGARMLHVGIDPAGSPALWAIVDQDAPRHPRELVVIGTGRELPVESASYVGTYQLGAYVYHCFERLVP